MSSSSAVLPLPSWRRFRILVEAEALSFVRIKPVLFWIILFPMALLMLFATIFGKQHAEAGSYTLPYIYYLTPSMIVFSVMSNGIITHTVAMVTFRRRGILRRIQTTPLPVAEFIGARVLTHTAVMLVQSLGLVAVAELVFGARYSAAQLAATLPVVVVAALLFMTIGQAIATLVKREEVAVIVGQTVNMNLMFLGGLAVPLFDFPPWLRAIGACLPSAMMARLVTVPMIGMPVDSWTVWCMVGVAIYFAVSLAIAIRFFRWR